MAGPDVKNSLRALIAGDASRANGIDITDAGVERLVKAYPNLAVVKLQGTRNLRKKAFPAILRNCASIEAVTITVAKSHVSPKTRLTSFLDWLMDKEFVQNLRYLEFRGVYYSNTHRNFLDFLTKRRPALEIVFEWEGRVGLIRDMEQVPLSLGSDSNDDDDWEDESDESEDAESDDGESYDDGFMDDESEDDHLISDDPMENARTLHRLGGQSAMRDMLGRDLYDFEMASDYGDIDDHVEEGDGVSRRDMKNMLKLHRRLDRMMGMSPQREGNDPYM
ncbi:hypothetical protein BDV95DRAFT_123261 [Massariosphaeria phaeospora]|uniref:Uncharacterized protein n=1 Tax=Massariosphaeria phaeospora TaxID=100035 RepID=A0A7C8MGF8_9PLEO|nr:hypothetical protein BDV95DRAFT_123261 [Massariosphaeria phaeospora]